jgi:hypothetical protein
VGVILLIGVGIGLAIAIAGLIVALTGAGLLLGLALIVAGAMVAIASGALLMAHDLYRSLREWRELFREGGPDELRLVSARPPKGFLLRREATLTFEARRGDGPRKRLERGIPVPIPQAFLWRVLGRIPTPIGRLTDERKLNLALRRRKGRSRGAARPPAPEPPQS